jgi:predicted SAM-dependent methyltransferase
VHRNGERVASKIGDIVLRPGGTLRLAVPDFEALVRVYLQGGDLAKIVGPLYGRWALGGGNCIYHRTVYDFRTLSEVLVENGFVRVRRYDWRETIHRDHDDYSQAYVPHLDKENGILVSLNVEADKAG